MRNPLTDKIFLKQLDKAKNKIIYVRITALDINDLPIEQIEGRATGGSINGDGASSLRRSCNVSMIAIDNTENITDAYWALENKFKLEIGLQNNINEQYPDIIWFKQGIFIINSFSKNQNESSLTITISGQDKMCRLNGTISGKLPHDVDFGTEEFKDNNGNITIKKIPLYKIIYYAVAQYGQERAENIIINDLDEYGWELWEYRGDTPLYLIYQDGKVVNTVFNDHTLVSIPPENIPISKIPNYYSLNTLDFETNNNATVISYNNQDAYVIKVEYGDTVGYHRTELTYAGDLIASAGEPLTTAMLDKIVNMLGNYEYFYDLDGRFVFQKKKTYVQELFSPLNGDIITPFVNATTYSYSFDDEEMFKSISVSPQITNIKNDFSIWGTRRGKEDDLIHVRYAIDTKPSKYQSPYTGEEFRNEEYDWREIIYRMAIDFNGHSEEADFLVQIAKNNEHFPTGKTGYEQYYTDLLGYWRGLYNPNPEDKDKDLFYPSGSVKPYWNKQIHSDPSSFSYWIDFLDVGEGAEISKYSVKNIGVRSEVDNKSKNTSIYYQDTPEIQFIIIGKDTYDSDMSYVPFQISDNMREAFAISSQSQSLISKANDLIYKHTCINESLTITSIPIFYLEPNSRIYIEGKGDYLIDKIGYQLNYNGTMNLTCTKAIDQIY